jgi:nucleotidyltransferase substrate binding protein (TIGR01987 family)
MIAGRYNNPLKVNVLNHAILMFDNSTERLNLSFSKLNDALAALGIVIKHPSDPDRIVIDATIQRFEFSFELFWLLLKEIIKSKGVKDINFPRDVLSSAFSHNLISNEDIWLNMLTDRNKTSHTYDKELADIIYINIKSYFPIMQSSFIDLKSKFLPK